MKRLQLIHQEQGSECFEILMSTIVEDKQLKEWTIDKNTLLHTLPEHIVNQFLNLLGTDERQRSLMLYLIAKGSLVIHCDEED